MHQSWTLHLPGLTCQLLSAAEANIFGDPVAADLVFGQSVPTRLVALDTSQQCRLTADQLEGMRGRGKYGSFLADITAFYLQFHR